MSESASSSQSDASGTSSSASGGSSTRCDHSFSTCMPERGSGGRDFASTALWAVVLSTVFATMVLSVILCILKRKIRQRNREQIRAFLWDMVRGVQNGTVEEAVLQRIIYGVDPEVLEQKQPMILETSLLSGSTYASNLAKVPSATSFRTTSFDREWKWHDLLPVSATEPFSPSDPFGLVPDTGPKPALLQLPWKDHSKLPQAVSHDEANAPLGRVATTTRLPGIERQLDAVFLIAMPQLRTPGFGPQAIVSLPVTLASASPAFYEDYLYPIVPPRPKRILAIQREQRPDPLSSTGRRIEGPGVSWFGQAAPPSVRSGPLIYDAAGLASTRTTTHS